MSLKSQKLRFRFALAITASVALTFGGTSVAFATEDPSTTSPSTEEVVAPAAAEPAAEVAPPQEPAPAPVEEVPVEQPEATEPAPEAPAPVEDTTSTEPVAEAKTPAETTPSEEPVAPVDAAKTPPTEEQPLPACIDQVNWSFTYDRGTNSGTITAASDQQAQSTQLCDPLAVLAAKWKYMTAALFPQHIDNAYPLTVETLGTFSFGTGALDCGQGDIYAQFASKGGFGALTLPPVLTGPGQPFEPPFLHDILGGNGPYPTYVQTSTEGCGTTPEVPAPRVETREQGGFVCGDAEFTLVTFTKTIPYKLVPNEYGVLVPVDDVDNITETSVTTKLPLTEEEIESCKPATPDPKVSTTEWVKGHPVCDATTVDETRSVSTTVYTPVLASGSTWELQEKTTTVTETRTVPVDKVEACPTIVVPPASALTPDKPAPKPTPPPGLADTGADTSPYLGVSVLLLLAGVMTVIARNLVARRKAAEAKK